MIAPKDAAGVREWSGMHAMTLPVGARMVSWSEPDGTARMHAVIEYHSEERIHPDVRQFPGFAVDAILERVGQKVAKGLVRHIAQSIPLWAVRELPRVRELEQESQEMARSLEWGAVGGPEKFAPLTHCAQRGRDALMRWASACMEVCE